MMEGVSWRGGIVAAISSFSNHLDYGQHRITIEVVTDLAFS